MAGGDVRYVRDRRLHYAHNDRGLHEHTVAAAEDVPEGKVTLRDEVESIASSGSEVGRAGPGPAPPPSADWWAGPSSRRLCRSCSAPRG